MSAAAVIIMRRKQLVQAFREVGATDAEHAVSLEQLGKRRSWLFDQMVKRDVFLAAGNGRYFMNEAVAEAFLASRRWRALIITGGMLFAFLAFWLLGQIYKAMSR